MKIICDALQQNKEQVTQAYFEIWTIKVGIGLKNNSSVDFQTFVFFTYLKGWPGHNLVHFAHRLQCTVTLNLNFTFLKTWNCFQLE